MDLGRARSKGDKLYARRTQLDAELDVVLAQLRALAEELLREGLPPREVHAITRWSPSQIRAIRQEIGVAPVRGGRPRGKPARAASERRA